jgi:hypothetical protein
VTLENREGCKPRPFGDGIRAEVSIKERNSYDYWAARKNGDFYAMQGYFEDQQGQPDALFFNTRIVRLTEALMFAGRFYASLGALTESKFSIRVTHRGLADRALKSIGNRVMFDTRSSHEPVSETETVIVLGTIHDTLQAGGAKAALERSQPHQDGPAGPRSTGSGRPPPSSRPFGHGGKSIRPVRWLCRSSLGPSPTVIDTLIAAVRAGELDDLFSQAAKTGTIGKAKKAS